MASTDNPSPATPRQPERSCIVCHKRKIRCDRLSPCSPCVQGRFECNYPQQQRPVRRASRKTLVTGVVSRISELERAVAAVSQRQLQAQNQTHAGIQSQKKRDILPYHPASDTGVGSTAGNRDASQASTTSQRGSSHLSSSTAVANARRHEPAVRTSDGSRCTDENPGDEVLLRKGSFSQYVNETLFSRVFEQEGHVRSAFSSPRRSAQHVALSPFNPMGILSRKSFENSITSYLPPKPAAIQLWRVFVDRVDPCCKVLHVPTDEVTIYTVIDDPRAASAEAVAKCYAVYFFAVVVMAPAEVTVLLDIDKYTCLSVLKTGIEQALAHSEFLEAPTVGLLQAFAVYLAAMRVHNSGRGIWMLNGLAIRAAESIGLHRDGKTLKLSPFESEIRRRVWWQLVAREGRAAEDHGYGQTSGTALSSRVDLPLNVHDVDLHPDMKELPPPRAGWTRMAIDLTSFTIAQACGRLMEASSNTREQRIALRTQVFREAKERMTHTIRLCNPVVPEQRMASKVVHLLFLKIDLVYRQRESMMIMTGNPGSGSHDLPTEENLLEALEVLETAQEIWEDALLQPFRWLTSSYPQFHMMLYILWHLCVVRPQGPIMERALNAVEYHFQTSRDADTSTANESRWIVLTAMKEKAASIMKSYQEKKAADGSGAEENTASGEMPTQQPRRQDGEEPGVQKCEMEDIDREAAFDDLQGGGLLDWSTILEDFQLDATDLSVF
ncbi:fungal specific transcription factor domain-containing protein [Sarocladium implicatum]|nr:fungal specific transcription factor domain-containing protein [Sarocladium implicatum]